MQAIATSLTRLLWPSYTSFLLQNQRIAMLPMRRGSYKRTYLAEQIQRIAMQPMHRR